MPASLSLIETASFRRRDRAAQISQIQDHIRQTSLPHANIRFGRPRFVPEFGVANPVSVVPRPENSVADRGTLMTAAAHAEEAPNSTDGD